MSYQVLARKWRPSTFAAMVGQELVLQALVNALDSNRLHHAYLFTGTRGVGKTSIARLFAKALNCEQGVSSKPCGECSPCREISEGRFVDLIEVDAASRTKVEDTRELMDNVQYAPTQGRYKVYLIDEVHMLSTHSFNALLKTLEEPPPHIKFLLATTDPKKLPMTILSRCLQFNLKNMVPEKIVDHLKRVLQAEQIPFEENALWLLARAANGSMRDAMSLTDQGIAFGSGRLQDVDVRSMLGSVDQRQVLGLLQQLAQGSAKGVLNSIADMAQFGTDSDSILAELLGMLHRVGIAQMLPEAIDNSQGDRDEIIALAGTLRAEDVQLFYQIALHGRRDLPHVPVPREGLEMTLLRMLAFRPVNKGELALPEAQPGSSSTVTAAAIATSAAREVASAVSTPVSAPSSKSAPAPAPDYDDPPPWGGTTPAGGLGSKKPEAPAAAKPEPLQAPEPSAPRSLESSAAIVCDSLTGDLEVEAVAVPAAKAGIEQGAEAIAETAEAGAGAGAEVDTVECSSPEPAVAGLKVGETAVETPVAVVDTSVVDTSVVDTSVGDTSVGDTSVVDASSAEGSTAEAPLVNVGIEQDASLLPVDVTFGGELAARWVALIDQIGLSGMTYNIAANASLRSVTAAEWCFTLAGEQIHLFNDTHRQRLAQALSEHLGETVSVVVVEADAAGETPSQYQQRKREERQLQAVQAIENDKTVQAIIANYDARIDPDSIRPVENGEPVR